MRRKKKKPLGPRAKRMKRAGRLASAHSSWLKKFDGKNIVAGYRKHFGVDWMCAFTELEMLGVPIDANYKRKVLKSVECDREARQRKKAKSKETYDSLIEQDEHFAYIAGYTEAGFAFGITWEEWEKFEQEDSLKLSPEPYLNDEFHEPDLWATFESLPDREFGEDPEDLPF